jgi:Mor family transcriptional regulator
VVIEDDIVADILGRVAATAALPPDVVERIDRDVRRDWGGERPYIARVGEVPARNIRSARDERVRADYMRGERVVLLARRYGISKRSIQRILENK